MKSRVVSVVATCQRVEWGSGHCRDLPESSDLTVEARLGRLMEQNGSLSLQSKRRSDVSEVADESTIIETLGANAAGGSYLL